MRSLMAFSSRRSRRTAIVLLVLVAAALVPGVPAKAADATHIELDYPETEVTAVREVTSFDLTAVDGDGFTDPGYTGTVTISAADCADCLEISQAESPFVALSNNQYTFTLVDGGMKTLFIRWNEAGVGTRTLHASATLAGGGTDEDDADGATTVLSNNPAVLDMSPEPSTSAIVGQGDSIGVTIRNAQNQTDPNTYTGTVSFTASCGTSCFSISPNNSTGGGNANQYTYVAGDNASKQFTLTWLSAGTNRDFTASDTGLATTPSETRSGINVAEAETTTTSTTTTTTSTTTTTTTLPTTTTSTSTTTTSTTAVPRTTAAQVVTGPGAGGGPHVIVRRASSVNSILAGFMAYDPSFSGGVRVAMGDVDNDGYDDVVTAPGPGGGPHVKVFSGKALPAVVELGSFMAYEPGFTGGIYVATGDVNRDGKADVITAPDAGGGPHVRIWDGASMAGASAAEIRGFMAYETGFTGGVRVASANFDGDSGADVVAAPGAGGGPHVRVWNGLTGAELGGGQGFWAYSPSYTGGVFLAAAQGQTPLIFTGAGPGGGRHVRALDIHGAEAVGFFADQGPSAGSEHNGAVPAVGEANTKASDFWFVSRAVNVPVVQRFDFGDGHEVTASNFTAYAANVGVYVAVGVL